MAGVRKFTELKFWQRSREWSKRIFYLTRRDAFKSDRRLVSQINDSSESVMANIAEGFGRGTQGEFVQFLGYANGSLNETLAHLCAAYDREFISKEDFAETYQEGTEIQRMMIAFMKSMTKQGSGVKHMRREKSWKEWTEENWERFEKLTGQQRPEWLRKIEARKAELDRMD